MNICTALPWPEVDSIARQVAGALEVAHGVGIIHRDIKGENLHVETRRDGRLHVRLLDFGLAKMARRLRPDGVADSDIVRTRTGQIMGSPPCMAPEQVLAMDVDGRSDLYSFGIVLFECLAGSLPFDAATAYEMLRMHVHAPPPRPASRPGGKWVPAEVEDAVLALLQKRPSQRPQTAVDFLALWDAGAPAGRRAWEAWTPP
ncbi:MAG: serine/threonine protein kinase [Myxococcales bacterium]|nr:serine/threonine protein kinase [Myxococcales bacterium]